MAGLFISFEGREGCGKSTQIRALAERLRNAGQTVQQLREPGGTDLGEAIRSLLQHDAAGEGMCAESELLLFAASRAQLTRQTIQPALADGAIVLCDRFMDSTTVYQGVARALAPGDVAAINQFAVGATTPDLTVLIDLAPEVGLERVETRSQGQLDRIEREAIEFSKPCAPVPGAGRPPATALRRARRCTSHRSPRNQIWDAVKPRLT